MENGIIHEQNITITAQRKRSVLSCESIETQIQTTAIEKYAPFFALLESLMEQESKPTLQTDTEATQEAS